VTSFDVKRKRPWWLGWIPAVVLLVIIGGVATATILLINAGLGSPAPKPTEGQVTDLNWSIFTPEGLDYIDRTREVRIDLSSTPVAAEPLGLEADGSLTIGPKNNGDVQLDYYLIVNGGGQSPGGDKFTMSQLTIDTASGVVTSVHGPLTETLNFRQTLDKLLAKAELFGWDTSGVAAIYQQVEDAVRAGDPYEFTFGPADRLGVPIAATASCDPGGYCLVEYAVTPTVR
jgi:hypothetical protein